MAWRRRKRTQPKTEPSNVIARLETIADRQEIVYARLVRLLDQIATTPVEGDRMDKDAGNG